MSTVLRGNVRRYGPSALSVGIALSVGVGFFITAPEKTTAVTANRPAASTATVGVSTAAARFLESAKLSTHLAVVAKAPGR